MAQIKCKCGEMLVVVAGADQVACPACHATYRVRVARPASDPVSAPDAPPQSTDVVASSPPPPDVPVSPAARPSRSGTARRPAPSSARQPVQEKAPDQGPRSTAPLFAAICGALLTLAACVLLVLSYFTKPGSNQAALQKKNELQQKLIATQTALLTEQKTQDTLRASLAEAEQKTKVLLDQEKELDRRYAVAGNVGPGRFAEFEEQRKKNEQDLREIEEKLKRGMEATDPTRAIAKAEKAVIVIRTDIGAGSGFVLNSDGMAVTNYHVVEGSSKLTVNIQKSASREQVELPGARIIAADAEHDLALIQLPAPPDTVAADGGYAAVTIRSQDVSAGENVFAIGSPGFKKGLLDYTVSTGIVSNPRRLLGKNAMIQTSAPVNPGNSGGPLFDSAGNVIGVVAAKGIDVEAVGFAIPTSTLNDFVKKREDTGVAVGNLKEWERDHNPARSLTLADRSTRDKYGVVLPEACTTDLLSADGKTLYLLYGHSGKIQEYLIETGKLGRTVDSGAQLDDMTLRGSSGHLVAVSATTRKLLLINSRTMALEKEAILHSPAFSVSYLGGANEYVICMNMLGGAVGESVLVGQSDFGHPGEIGIEMPRTMLTIGSGSSAKYAAFISFNIDKRGGGWTLRAYPAAQCLQQFAEWSAFRQQNARLKPNELFARLDNLAQKLAAGERKVELSPAEFVPQPGPVLFSDPERLLLGRRAYKIGAKIEPDVLFEASPVLSKPETLTEQQRQMHTL